MSRPSETAWVSRYFDVCVRPSSRSCSLPLVDPDDLGFGDDVGARCLPDLFSCGEGLEVEPRNVESREPEVIMMRAVAFRRLGPVIMPVARQSQGAVIARSRRPLWKHVGVESQLCQGWGRGFESL